MNRFALDGSVLRVHGPVVVAPWILLSASLALAGLFWSPRALAQSSSAAPDLAAPTQLVARDSPGDTGGSILLTWSDPDSTLLPSGTMVEVLRTPTHPRSWERIAEVPLGVGRYADRVPSRTPYVYAIRTRARRATTGEAGQAAGDSISSPSIVSPPVSAHDNWFRAHRTNSLIAMIVLLVATLGSIRAARSGKEIFIRRISGLNAVDEAIGRATETGKKVLYVPGIQSMDDIQTVASLSILGYVARATARYGAELDCTNNDPLTFASAREAVRAAYLAEGRPDLYREGMVSYITYDQYAYAAAVSARMVRERPATIFLIGHFFAESLILAETGQSTGAIQIAGMADPTQLPFFIATCDYTLIGEELYAASAYLSREPVLLGSVRGQDLFKAIAIVVGLIGIVVATLGSDWVARMLMTR